MEQKRAKQKETFNIKIWKRGSNNPGKREKYDSDYILNSKNVKKQKLDQKKYRKEVENF